LHLCVCVCVCVYKPLCAAQIQCRSAHGQCCHTWYVCAGNALCMNIDVSVKAYFSSLHNLLFHFVQNPYVLSSYAGPSSPIVFTVFIVDCFLSECGYEGFFPPVVKHWTDLIQFRFSDKVHTKYNPPIVQRSLLLIAIFWNSLLLALVSFLPVIVFSKASYGWLC